jgi:predicted amidohydrolase
VQDLIISPVQCELRWENPADNRRQIGALIERELGPSDLIILPEMFTTGFSMNAVGNAESPGGPTEEWLRELAVRRDCAITGSIALRTAAGIYNRLLFVTPDRLYHYDKRHLFRMAGEHKRYLGGNERVVVPWRGWRINLQVCYDLRFPVFSRNRGDYDLLLYVANWPSRRRAHWRQLLLARAIENQACVVGVNRVGSDANGLDYSGDSLVVAGDGELLLDMESRAGAAMVTLEGAALEHYRAAFPCHLDADDFTLL